MPPARPRDGTDDHPGPARPQLPRGREALVVAFPTARALPVPVAGTPLGRDWLATHGAPDTRVSTSHVAFAPRGSKLFIEDLGSRNGTFVDGLCLPPNQPVAIEDGARVRVGRTLLVYRSAFFGADTPSPNLGDLVAPFGLRDLASALDALRNAPSVGHLNVLIQGETGTGKELVARRVAEVLDRGRTYAAVNIAGVAPGVFEGQLFGYADGAYSGAVRGGSRGLLLEHNRGAVFLDEIGDLPSELQPKLLRFLDYRDVLPVGAARGWVADLLVIAATWRNVEELARDGHFREDLLARFGARLELPPLRERVEDLFEVMQAIVGRHGRRYDPMQVEVEAVERLALHPWRRNVRELASALERIAAFAPPPALPFWAVERALGPLPADASRTLTMETVQRVLESCGGNESAAARTLDITRARLRRFLQKA